MIREETGYDKISLCYGTREELINSIDKINTYEPIIITDENTIVYKDEFGTLKDFLGEIKKDIDNKEDKITKNTAFNKDFGTNDDEVLEGAKLAEVLGVNYGGTLNNNSTKTAGKAYYDTATKAVYLCKINNNLNYADLSKFEDFSNKGLLGKLENLGKNESVVLFEGSAQQTGVDITLTEPFSNFLYLNFLVSGSNHQASTRTIMTVSTSELLYKMNLTSNNMCGFLFHVADAFVQEWINFYATSSCVLTTYNHGNGPHVDNTIWRIEGCIRKSK